ncbi:hypothetical protein Cme02nite_12240 [Catellatospora methionotrophica]|uniref:Uncharacterized protein n=1 Tax=Catellatospora methionotrophica TaxID=121620 RepID=A0A8J3L682_9ACTN|nr:hypothetical protein [Catellatospora methionotrophica]GIG12892.1 hypothetical protein Cme02nite_12240 [Catellatospora methionotrophica]
MSRSVRHLTANHHLPLPLTGTALRVAELFDLRYSDACLRDAHREGRRPRPRRLRHRIEVHRWARWRPGDGDAARFAAQGERQARQRLRLALRAAVRDPRDPDLDVLPYHHHHGAQWLV